MKEKEFRSAASVLTPFMKQMHGQLFRALLIQVQCDNKRNISVKKFRPQFLAYFHTLHFRWFSCSVVWQVDSWERPNWTFIFQAFRLVPSETFSSLRLQYFHLSTHFSCYISLLNFESRSFDCFTCHSKWLEWAQIRWNQWATFLNLEFLLTLQFLNFFSFDFVLSA